MKKKKYVENAVTQRCSYKESTQEVDSKLTRENYSRHPLSRILIISNFHYLELSLYKFVRYLEPHYLNF